MPRKLTFELPICQTKIMSQLYHLHVIFFNCVKTRVIPKIYYNDLGKNISSCTKFSSKFIITAVTLSFPLRHW